MMKKRVEATFLHSIFCIRIIWVRSFIDNCVYILNIYFSWNCKCKIFQYPSDIFIAAGVITSPFHTNDISACSDRVAKLCINKYFIDYAKLAVLHIFVYTYIHKHTYKYLYLPWNCPKFVDLANISIYLFFMSKMFVCICDSLLAFQSQNMIMHTYIHA